MVHDGVSAEAAVASLRYAVYMTLTSIVTHSRASKRSANLKVLRGVIIVGYSFIVQFNYSLVWRRFQ